MKWLWTAMKKSATNADGAWVNTCAQSLIRMRPNGDLEELIETAIGLWPTCKDLDPVQVAHAHLLGNGCTKSS